jgi:hypothetical protein
MGLLTSISNKVQYLIYKNVSDPDADAYAKQQAEQAAQDAKVKEEQDKVKAAAVKAAAAKAEADAAAADLAARSRFSPKKLLGDISRGIIYGLITLVVVCFIIYGGTLAANQAIGYNIPFRLLSFLYGMIFSFIIIPKSLYDVYWVKKTLPYYSLLPISTYAPTTDLEKVFLGAFCYTETAASIAARSAVVGSYMNAFQKSVSTVAPRAEV